MLTDPGSVPPSAQPIRTTAGIPPRQCRVCRTYKPPRAHHCSICDRCITKMDHHCPWVNNCVAFGNQKFFLLFVGYVMAISAHSLVLTFTRFYFCMRPNSTCPNESVVSIILMVVLAMLFGLFTCCMLCDQMSAIVSGNTAIDRLQSAEAHGDTMSHLAEVFGGKPGFSIFWLLPTSVRFEDKQAITQYRTEEETEALV